MKKRTSIILIMAFMAVICLNACGKDKEDRKADSTTVQSEQEEQTESVKKTDEEKDTQTGVQLSKAEDKKNELKLKIEPDLEAEIDENVESLIISDEDGNSAKVQIGVAEGGTVIPDAPDGPLDNTIENKPDVPKTPENTDTSSQSKLEINGNHNSGWDTTYEEYEAMSGTEQTIFYYSFADSDEFLDWYNKAKAEYEAEQEKIYIGMDGVVNAGENN